MKSSIESPSINNEDKSVSKIDEYKEIEERLDNPDPKQSVYEAGKVSELGERLDNLKEDIVEDYLTEQSEEYKNLKKKLDEGNYVKDNSGAYVKDQARLSELRKSLYEKSLKDSNPEYKKLKEKLDDADYVKDNTDVYRKDLQKLKRLEKGLNNSLVDNIVSSKLEPKKETLNGGEQAKLNTESSNVPSSIEVTEDKKVEQETTTEEKKTEEIIKLTDIVSDEEMDHYRKMSSKELTGQHKELKQALEESGSELTNKEANEIKKAIGIIEKIEEEVGLEVESNQELKESWDNLEDTRNEYIRLHQSYLQEGVLSGVRSALGISSNREMSPELIEAKEKYDLAKKTYAKNEQTVSLEKIDDNLSDEEKEKQKEQIKNKIFNIVVLDEQEYLQDAQAESHPPKERGIFMKAYDRWTSLSKTKRLIYSTVMVAGVAGYATLAVPVTASAAALGVGGVAGKKLMRGAFGMVFSGLAGKIFDRQIAGKKEEIKQTADTETESTREEFDLDNLEKIENQYKDTIEQERKGNRNILIGRALVVGGAGMTSAMGLGMADNALAGTSVVDDTDIETAQKGDSIWKMSEDQLEKHYGAKFTGLEEAQKTYLIDAIKDKIIENPANFGMTDIDSLKVGQEIDFTSVFTNESEVNKFFEKANDLSDIDKENILSNNQKIEDWAKENPDSKLDSEQVESVINPVIESDIPDADVEAKTEFKFEGEVDGGEIKTEAQTNFEDFENRMKQDPQAIEDSISTAEMGIKATDNMTSRLTEIGGGHRLFGWGSGQFMKEGGEWDKLKDLKIEEVIKKDFDYYGKDALNKAVNGATQDNLKGLNNYMEEAKKLIGKENRGETLENYLKRYEIVKQL